VPTAISNEKLLDAFAAYLKVEKGLARLSVSAYLSDLLQFAEFLKGRKRALLAGQREDVRQFLQQLFANQVDGRSVARKLSALRHFYRYLLLDDLLEHDPTLNIDSPKRWKVLPKALGREEMETVLHGPKPTSDSKIAQAIAERDRAMLEVFYAGALRVSEIIGVKMEDLKLELGYVLVRGKGDKERMVPIGRTAMEALGSYLRKARPVLVSGNTCPWLFPGRGARQLSRQPDLSVTDVAFGNGFNSSQSFATCFRRRFKVSPSQFASNHTPLGRRRDPSRVCGAPSSHRIRPGRDPHQ